MCIYTRISAVEERVKRKSCTEWRIGRYFVRFLGGFALCEYRLLTLIRIDLGCSWVDRLRQLLCTPKTETVEP